MLHTQEAQVKDAYEKHLLQTRNLEKVRQCLASSVRDYDSEKKELHKACLVGHPFRGGSGLASAA